MRQEAQRAPQASRGPGEKRNCPPGPGRCLQALSNPSGWRPRGQPVYDSVVSFYFQVKKKRRITIWFFQQLIFLSISLGPSKAVNRVYGCRGFL